jgi:hypothetical protein
MSIDLRESLRSASAESIPPLDVAALQARTRRLRRRRTVGRVVGVLTVALVALSATTVLSDRDADTPHVRVASPPTPASATDEGVRLTSRLPPGWFQADAPLVPNLSSPEEILAAGTVPLRADSNGPGCDAQLPKGTLDMMQPTDAFVWMTQAVAVAGQPLFDVDGRDFPARPSHFSLEQFGSFPCDNPPLWSYPHLTFHWLWFNEGGHVIGAYVVLGDQISAERQNEVWTFLDSVEFAGVQIKPVTPGTASPSDCVASGTDSTIVPSVLGYPLGHAIDVMQRAGLNVVGYGAHEPDPTGPTARVRAQEPGAGLRVPLGACVGFRTDG